VTHRFHPLFGREFEFVARRHNWGEDRVHLHDENGVLFSLPAGWTDAVPVDVFALVAAGRCPFTTTGLLELAGLTVPAPALPASRAAPATIAATRRPVLRFKVFSLSVRDCRSTTIRRLFPPIWV
jgi:hypothetical protein